VQLRVTRLDERRYETVVRRPDGVCFRVTGVGHMFAIPHDLAHLAIEEALQLNRGFWGSIADGAVFDSMAHVSGRRRPGATARSAEVLRANQRHLTEAEVLVRIFNDALQEGHGPESAELRARLRDHQWPPPGDPPRQFTDAEITAACAAWRRMLALWQRSPVGGTLEFTWPTGPARGGRRSR
jgi:hypothetical protein